MSDYENTKLLSIDTYYELVKDCKRVFIQRLDALSKRLQALDNETPFHLDLYVEETVQLFHSARHEFNSLQTNLRHYKSHIDEYREVYPSGDDDSLESAYFEFREDTFVALNDFGSQIELLQAWLQGFKNAYIEIDFYSTLISDMEPNFLREWSIFSAETGADKDGDVLSEPANIIEFPGSELE